MKRSESIRRRRHLRAPRPGSRGVWSCFQVVGVAGFLGIVLGACTSLAADDLGQVEAHYLFGEYDQALQLLGRLIDAGLASPSASVEAQVWRARCLVQKGHADAALQAFCRVREVAPEWRPDRAILPANELELFQRALAECAVGPAALSIISRPPGARVWLDGDPVDGVTPLLDLPRAAGRCSLTVHLDGFLDHEKPIEVKWPATTIEVALEAAPIVPVEVDTQASVGAPPETETLADAPPPAHASKTRGGAVIRSVVPGLGQMYKGQRTKGVIVLVAALTAAGVAYAGHAERGGAVDDYEARRNEYLSAVPQAEIDAAYARMLEAWDSVRDAEKLRDAGIYAFLGIYLYNLVDAALGFPLAASRVQVSAEATQDGQARLALTLGARGRIGGQAANWRP